MFTKLWSNPLKTLAKTLSRNVDSTVASFTERCKGEEVAKIMFSCNRWKNSHENNFNAYKDIGIVSFLAWDFAAVPCILSYKSIMDQPSLLLQEPLLVCAWSGLGLLSFSTYYCVTRMAKHSTLKDSYASIQNNTIDFNNLEEKLEQMKELEAKSEELAKKSIY